MAVLAKIRQRSVLLIGAIALALFAFIIQDLIGKGGISQSSKDVGSINGKDISFEDFRIKVNNVEKSSQGITSTQAANSVWNQEVSLALMTSEFDKLGIRAGEKHIFEALKANPNIGRNPSFLNAAGLFDVVKFKEFFKANPAQAVYLKETEKEAELNAKFQIYSTMIRSGLYVTNSEAKLGYEMEANKANFSYVAGLYSSIKDSDVKVENSEIVDYMKKNEKKFKADESREVEYVLIEDKASKEDEANITSRVNSLLSGSVVYNQKTGKNDTLAGFRDTKNIIDFVNSNSDVPYDSTYVAKNDLPAVDADKLFNLTLDEIYGPYKNGNYLCISKLLDKKEGVKARASHILISYEGTNVPNQKEKRTKEEAKAKAEEILAQIKENPDSFLMMAFTASDDSSGQQGGDLGFFGPNQMVKPFNDYVFSNPIGSIGLVETSFGFHIIKITDRQDGVRLATIAQKIEPSEATSDKMFTQATKFEMEAVDKDFNALAKQMALKVETPAVVKVMDEQFGAIGNQRTIVRWAFDKETSVGDVKRFEVANLGHVIARLKKVNEEGLIPVEQARQFVEPVLKKEKKAAMLKKKMTGSTLETIAKTSGDAVLQATDVTMANPMLTGVGLEPKVVGNVFGLGTNKISEPIEGNKGVYVVKTNSITKGVALKDYTQYVAKIKEQSSNSDASRVLPALKENAEIEDNRSQFNY